MEIIFLLIFTYILEIRAPNTGTSTTHSRLHCKTLDFQHKFALQKTLIHELDTKNNHYSNLLLNNNNTVHGTTNNNMPPGK